MGMASTWGMSLKKGEEWPGGDEQGVEDAWEGKYKNGLDE